MGKKKYRLKAKYGGQVSLTSATFACTIKKGQELELSDVEVERMKDYIEPVPVVRKKKTEEVRVTDFLMENKE